MKKLSVILFMLYGLSSGVKADMFEDWGVGITNSANDLGNAVGGFVNNVIGPLQGFIGPVQTILDITKTVTDSVSSGSNSSSLSQFTSSPFMSSADAVVNIFGAITNSIVAPFTLTSNSATNSFEAVFENSTDLFVGSSNSVTNSITDSITTSSANITTSIADSPANISGFITGSLTDNNPLEYSSGALTSSNTNISASTQSSFNGGTELLTSAFNFSGNSLSNVWEIFKGIIPGLTNLSNTSSGFVTSGENQLSGYSTTLSNSIVPIYTSSTDLSEPILQFGTGSLNSLTGSFTSVGDNIPSLARSIPNLWGNKRDNIVYPPDASINEIDNPYFCNDCGALNRDYD